MYPGPVSGSGCSAGGGGGRPTLLLSSLGPPAASHMENRPAPTSTRLHQRGENIRGVDTGHWLVAGGDQIFDWLID